MVQCLGSALRWWRQKPLFPSGPFHALACFLFFSQALFSAGEFRSAFFASGPRPAEDNVQPMRGHSDCPFAMLQHRKQGKAQQSKAKAVVTNAITVISIFIYTRVHIHIYMYIYIHICIYDAKACALASAPPW